MSKLKYALGLSTILSLPLAAQDDMQQYLSFPTQTLQTTAQIGQAKSNWFWAASTRITNEQYVHAKRKYPDFSGGERSQYNQKYFVFPKLITKGLPILGKALEVSINKAVYKRLNKTAAYYEHAETFDRLQRQIETMQMKNPDIYANAPLFSSALHHARLNLGQFNNIARAPHYKDAIATTAFDNTIHHGIDSVLDYYDAARRQSGGRMRGEIGYETNSVNWRIGVQKQKTKGYEHYAGQQERKSVYSALSWDISDRVNYFNVFTREEFENNNDLNSFTFDIASHYHRLSYAVNDNVSLFTGQGRSNSALFGQTEFRHSGVQDCSTLQNTWQICSGISYQESSYKNSNTEHYSAQEKSGIHLTLSAKLRF
jgi:hypothetical protein